MLKTSIEVVPVAEIKQYWTLANSKIKNDQEYFDADYILNNTELLQTAKLETTRNILMLTKPTKIGSSGVPEWLLISVNLVARNIYSKSISS